MDIEQKQCGKCFTIKSRGDFYKNITKPDGVQLYCKDCTKVIDKISYQRKKENHKATIIAISPVEGQTCSACKVYKTSNQFNLSKTTKSGLLAYCIDCYRIREKKRYDENKDKRELKKEQNKHEIYIGLQKCISCLQEKNHFDFSKRKLGKNGLNPYCKDCYSLRQKKYRLENPDLYSKINNTRKITRIQRLKTDPSYAEKEKNGIQRKIQ